MLVGVLVVVAGAVAFGVALFGPRPVPQTATPALPPSPGAETAPSAAPAATFEARPEVLSPVVPTPRTRVRALLWLTLGVIGTAAMIGAVLGLVGLVVITFVG